MDLKSGCGTVVAAFTQHCKVEGNEMLGEAYRECALRFRNADVKEEQLAHWQAQFMLSPERLAIVMHASLGPYETDNSGDLRWVNFHLDFPDFSVPDRVISDEEGVLVRYLLGEIDTVDGAQLAPGILDGIKQLGSTYGFVDLADHRTSLKYERVARGTYHLSLALLPTTRYDPLAILKEVAMAF